MKYVVLHHPSRGPIVVAGLNLKHDELATPWLAQKFTAQSAGFFRLLERERFECFGWSDSLKLGPHADDARLLSAFYSASLRTAPAAIPSVPSVPSVP